MVLTANKKKTILPSSSSSSSDGRGGEDDNDDDLPIVYASTFPQPPPPPVVSPSTSETAASSSLSAAIASAISGGGGGGTEQQQQQQYHQGRYGDEMGDIQPEIPLSIVEVDPPQPPSPAASHDHGGDLEADGNTNTEEGTTNNVGDDETKTCTHTPDNTCAFNIGSGCGGESPWERKCRRRQRRKARMVVGGLTGLVVGTVILCVPGAILGSVVGVWATRSISKRRERLKDERIAMSSASSSAAEEVDGPVAVATHVGDAKESN